MRNEGLQFNSVCRKIGGPEVATNEPLALDTRTYHGGPNMPVEGIMGILPQFASAALWVPA